jgi:hypothetical protein
VLVELAARWQLVRAGRWGQRRRGARLKRDALATSSNSRNRKELSCSEKKLARLRHDETLSGELMLEAKRAARRDDAERIVQVESDGEIARGASNVDGSGNNRRSENAKLGGRGKLNAHAAEIQCERNRRAGLKDGEFRGAANVDFAAAEKRHARFSGVDRNDAAICNKHTAPAGGSGIRPHPTCFDGNVTTVYTTNCASRRLRLLRTKRDRVCCKG